MSGAFKEAWRNDLIPDNPVARTPRLAPQRQRQIDALSMDRVQQIIAEAEAEAENERFRVLFRPWPTRASASARLWPWSGSTST